MECMAKESALQDILEQHSLPQEEHTCKMFQQKILSH